MPKLLHIDSSPLYARSASRELTASFVTEGKASNPGKAVVSPDLNPTTIFPITAAWVGAHATFLTACGTKVLNQGQDRKTFLATYFQAARTHARFEGAAL